MKLKTFLIFVFVFLIVFQKNVLSDEKKEIFLKFRDVPVKEVLNSLATQFEFGYVIEYPDFEILSKKDLKEVFFTPLSSEEQVSRQQQFTTMFEVTKVQTATGTGTTVSETGTGTTSPGVAVGFSVTEAKPLELGSDFENRLLNFVIQLEKAEVKEVVEIFCKVADTLCEYDEKKRFLKVIPYRVEFLDLGFFMDYTISHTLGLGSAVGSTTVGSTTGTGGSVTGTGGQTGGLYGGEGGSFFVGESFEQFIKQVLSGLRSREGRVYYSKRGYVVVIDRPSYVEKIKTAWQKEITKQGEVLLNVKVVRVDLKQGEESGIDWSGLITNLFGAENTSLRIAGQFAFSGEGVSFSFDSSRLDLLLKALEKYGNVKVVYDWSVKGRGGIPVVFADVQSIPYLTQSLSTTETGVVTVSTPQYVDVGFRITVIGSFTERNKVSKYEGQTFISISDLVSIENLGTVSSPFLVPNVKFSSVTVPFSLKSGESIIISSFKINKSEILKRGIPYLIRIPLLGKFFGYSKSEEGVSEIVVIITPQRVSVISQSSENQPVIIYKQQSNKEEREEGVK